MDDATKTKILIKIYRQAALAYTNAAFAMDSGSGNANKALATAYTAQGETLVSMAHMIEGMK